MLHMTNNQDNYRLIHWLQRFFKIFPYWIDLSWSWIGHASYMEIPNIASNIIKYENDILIKYYS